MTRKSLDGYSCSIARTLDIVGDQWSILIIRDAFLGIETFSDFQKRIGVARNILTNRLVKLVQHNILSKKYVSAKRLLPIPCNFICKDYQSNELLPYH